MVIEIVDLPIKNGGSFQFAMLVYQRLIKFSKSRPPVVDRSPFAHPSASSQRSLRKQNHLYTYGVNVVHIKIQWVHTKSYKYVEKCILGPRLS